MESEVNRNWLKFETWTYCQRCKR